MVKLTVLPPFNHICCLSSNLQTLVEYIVCVLKELVPVQYIKYVAYLASKCRLNQSAIIMSKKPNVS